MEGREGGDPGYDDWFDEPEPPTQEAGRGARGGVYDAVDEDVWVMPDDEPRRARRPGRPRELVVGGRTLTTTQAAILGVSALAIILAILAAAGVFSGNKAATPPITTPTTSTPPTTAASVPTVTTPSAQPPTQQLSPGDTGAQVKMLQRALTALGFSPGKADGYFGTATQTAVEQFQSSKGLTADGVVGPSTLTALQQALSG